MLQIIHERLRKLGDQTQHILPLWLISTLSYEEVMDSIDLWQPQRVTGQGKIFWCTKQGPWPNTFTNWTESGGPIDRPEEDQLHLCARWYADEGEADEQPN